MLFGLTLTKLMVIIALSMLLFGVPLMSFIVTIVQRRRERSEKGDHPWER